MSIEDDDPIEKTVDKTGVPNGEESSSESSGSELDSKEEREIHPQTKQVRSRQQNQSLTSDPMLIQPSEINTKQPQDSFSKQREQTYNHEQPEMQLATWRVNTHRYDQSENKSK